jgi:CelD/BcsL family acetyltransferase involved in cellulose biosynthesis
MLHVHRVVRLEEMDCLGAGWNALLDRDDPDAVFLRYEWVRNWYAAFGGGSTPHVLVASSAGRPVGILPLRAWRDRFAGVPLRRLDLMANGHSPACDLVAAPGRETEVLEAFAHYFLEVNLEWDVAVLPEVQTEARLARLAATFPPSHRLIQPERRSPFIPLGGSWETYRSGRSRNFQRALRNNRNRIARAGGAEVELLSDPGAIMAALEDMFAIGARSWQGEAGSAVGSTAANRRFYSGWVHDLSRLGLVRLWFLKLGGRRVAFELHVVHGGVEFGLKTGYDRAHEELGVGRFLDQSIVERLFDAGGLCAYDLCGEADAYKLRWTESTRSFARITLFGTRAPARLLSLWSQRLVPVLRQARDLGRRARASAGIGGAAAAAAQRPVAAARSDDAGE